MKPEILLLDEPFGALDPETREDTQLFLLDLWEETKMTIFFVTHDMEEAVFLGDRLIVLSQYYKDDRGDTYQRGAKIVADHHLPKLACATQIKKDPKFISLVNQIRQEGFDPSITQHVSDFNLRHKDSFQTLTKEEHEKD